MGLARFVCLGWCILVAAACGGDDDALEPEELIPDTAVEAGCSPEPLAVGQVRAKFVECIEERPAGRLASGRVGDIVIENANIEVVIRGFGEGFVFPGSYAGGIVDAAPVGGQDQLKEIQPIVELNAGAFDEIVITEAGDDGPAEVVVRGPAFVIPFIDAALTTQPLDALLELHYILEPDADELLLRMIAFGVDGEDALVQHGEALLFGGRVAIFIPNQGFIDGGATSARFIASTGDATTSYGLIHPPGTALNVIDISGVVASLGSNTSLGDPEILDRWFVVGDGSASSVTDRAWALRGEQTGTVRGTTAPGVAISVSDGDTPITRGRSGTDGAYQLTVPPGSYTLRAESIDSESPTRDPGAEASVTVTDGGNHTVDLEAGGTGSVTVTAEDDGGTPLPTRVVATRDGFRRIDWTDGSGEVQFDLAPGTYTVTVSRGMEYDAYTATGVEVTDGGSVQLDAILTRVVDTDGWIAVDTHLHSEMSTDSDFPLDLRLMGVAGEGVEIAISTDHDFIVDYDPIIEEIGLTGWLVGKAGEEISSLVWGHINAWPFVVDNDQPAGGGVHWYRVSPGEVMTRARNAGASIVQLNHPRNGSQSGVFDAIDLNPVTLTAQKDPEDLGLPPDTDLNVFDFDAVEVANDFNAEDFEESWVDWMALITHGHPAAATGSSDSHGPGAYSGNSRTYVYVGAGADDPASVDLDLVDANIKARRVIVAQGAFVLAGLEIPGTADVSLPGDLVDLGGETEARIAIRVQAPPWMPLQNIVIYGPNNEVARTINLDSGDTAAVRYDQTVAVPIDGTDTFFVVRVNPAGAGSPVLGTPDASFANPLMVDADGDGSWTAPN